METAELLKRVRKIEIKTRGLSNQIFSGEYHSAFKGQGMAFTEVREYQHGDPIRTIDWNVTARFNHPYVKVFEEERELTVMLLVDLSQSEFFGSEKQQKRELITEMCAVLAFSAIQNNDKIGVIFFTDRVEKFIPPKKGRTHTLRIIRELIDFKPESKGTNLTEALQFLNNAIKKRSTAFLLSDFYDSGFENALRIANKKHDLIALRFFDIRENELPDIGFVPMQDAETGITTWVDTSNAAVRRHYKSRSLKRQAWIENIFKRAGVDAAEIDIRKDYVRPLKALFKRRESKR